MHTLPPLSLPQPSAQTPLTTDLRAGPALGSLLRTWRSRRGVSQMALALEAGVSPRHLSFVETGRSRASVELVMALAGALDLPLRDRNALLLAAGHAPRWPESDFRAAPERPEMAAVQAAVERLLQAHDPYPGVALDRHWCVVAANSAAARLFSLLPAGLTQPAVNLFRASLHPEGFAAFTENFDTWGRYLVDALAQMAHQSGDPGLARLREEVMAYPTVQSLPTAGPAAAPPATLLLPCRLRIGGLSISLFTTLLTLTTPLDVTLSELKVELFYPADEASAQALRMADTPPGTQPAPVMGPFGPGQG